jgi:hypothetical protein
LSTQLDHDRAAAPLNVALPDHAIRRGNESVFKPSALDANTTFDGWKAAANVAYHYTNDEHPRRED